MSIPSNLSGPMGSSNSFMDFFFGKDPYAEKLPAFSQEQSGYQNQLLQSLGGNLPQAMKFLQSFLGNDEESLQQYSAPFLRQFRQKIVPSITERFGGGGASGMNESGASSGLYNALSEAGTGLEESLASGRQGMGLNAIGQLFGLNSAAMQSPFGYATYPAQQGLIQGVLQALAQGLASRKGG